MTENARTDWDTISKDVSGFVDNYLSRILGASNDVGQRVIVNERLSRKFFVGKLSPLSRSGQNEYQSKINPSSYIVSFLVAPPIDKRLQLSITPSCNLYFQTVIPSFPQQVISKKGDTVVRSYARLADPLPQNLATPDFTLQTDFTLQNGRADAWIPWNQRQSLPESLINRYLLFLQKNTQLKEQQVKTGEDEKTRLKRLFVNYDKLKANSAFIRKRYCRIFDVTLDLSNPEQTIPLDIDAFRLAHTKIGRSPEWQGHLQISLVEVNNENTPCWRVTIELVNSLSLPGKSTGNWDGSDYWYDVHLQIKLLDQKNKIVPLNCPFLTQSGSVLAETKNCGVAEESDSSTLLISPVARVRTIRQHSRGANLFEETRQNPAQSLKDFFLLLEAEKLSSTTLADFQDEITLLLGDEIALQALSLVSEVYGKAFGLDKGRWRRHQFAALIKIAARHISQLDELRPLVLNVQTAGGKTEAFFAGAMFCSFYETLKHQRAINIIKYPMTLLSSDQINRLAGFTMIFDELCERLSDSVQGIGYLVAQKGIYQSAAQVVQTCPYLENGKRCSASWVQTNRPLVCQEGHKLYLTIDVENQIIRNCPAFLVSTWDKFVSQSTQRRLGMLFGARRFRCPVHGFIDILETSEEHSDTSGTNGMRRCALREKIDCGHQPVTTEAPIQPGVLVFDEGHLIRESEGTLDAHFETAYLTLFKRNTGLVPVPVVSTATIMQTEEHLKQLGLRGPGGSYPSTILPRNDELSAFFEEQEGQLKHEAIALVPFGEVLTWSVPFLTDAFFECFRLDYGFDVSKKMQSINENLDTISHLKQIMIYCSSYDNINTLREMQDNAVAKSRQRRGLEPLSDTQLTSHFFTRPGQSIQKVIAEVRKQVHQFIYATNIASIGIDIDNLDVIFFFGLPNNVSEFIQALNRTGRQSDKPAICIAVLGPNKARDMSYFRYWSEFVRGANSIIEPVPLNRFSYSAIDRTFNNVATILILMHYLHRTGQKLYQPVQVLRQLEPGGLLNEQEILEILKEIYCTPMAPYSAEFARRVVERWEAYKSDLRAARNDEKNIWDVFKNRKRWLTNLRLTGETIELTYPALTDVLDQRDIGFYTTGEIDSNVWKDKASSE